MEKNKQNVRKGIIIGCIVSAAVLIGILGSYAYFINTGNNNKNQSANVQTGNMALTFEDRNNGINEALNFGESIIKTFTIENTGSLDVKARMNWKNLKNTYTKESLTYTLSYRETEDGEYTEIITNKNVPRSSNISTQTLANNLEIPSKTKYYYKLEITLNYLEDIDQTEDLNAILSTEFILEEEYEEEAVNIPKIVTAIKEGNYLPERAIKSEKPNYDLPATTDETRDGLYAIEDDYGTSYYYRGAVENNYVKFGGFYWRIIRINGDGSLRIIYDGTSAHQNGENNIDRSAIRNIFFNENSNDNKYVGYMYGPEGTTASTSKEQAQSNIENSNVKTQLENWYKTNIKEKGLDE